MHQFLQKMPNIGVNLPNWVLVKCLMQKNVKKRSKMEIKKFIFSMKPILRKIRKNAKNSIKLKFFRKNLKPKEIIHSKIWVKKLIRALSKIFLWKKLKLHLRLNHREKSQKFQRDQKGNLKCQTPIKYKFQKLRKV